MNETKIYPDEKLISRFPLLTPLKRAKQASAKEENANFEHNLHNAFSLLHIIYTSANPAQMKRNAPLDRIKIIKPFQVSMPRKVQKKRE